MAKLTLSDITSGYASTTAINTAFTAIEAALENTVSRDGTSPNQMTANLDLNGYALLNQRATNGNENFIWLGTWVTGTVYAVNNLVYAPEGTNEGATLICVTAHTAGATLDGDSAKWAVFSQRGASGAGTGDVVGPASSTADSLARFNGTTGKLLKDGAVIGTDVQAYSANLAALSSLSTGTSSGDIPLVGTSSATEDLAGLVELATTAEVITGTDTARAITPAGLVAAKIISGTAVSSTSGTAINFTSLPSWVSRVTISLSGVSTNGTSNLLIQIGDAGGIEATGYLGTGMVTSGGTPAVTAYTTGFGIPSISAANILHGIILLTLLDSSTAIWACSGNISASNTPISFFTSGSKSLSANPLSSVRITTVAGADVFDAGTINILYE